MSATQPIGIVASGSARDTITFYATKNIQTDYITVRDGTGRRFLYEVLRLTVQNSRLTTPDIARFIDSKDDYQRYNVYIGEAVPIACLEKGRTLRSSYMIAPPGSHIYPSTPKELSLVYDIAQDAGRQKIGTLLHQMNTAIYLDLDELLRNQVHLAVVGRTGSGKSWFVRHLLELLRMRSIVFSPTDEYDSIRVSHKVIGKADVVLQLNEETARRFFDLNPSERRFFESFIKNVMDTQELQPNELASQCAKYLRQSLTPKHELQQLSLLSESKGDGESPLPQYADSLCQKIENTDFKMQKLIKTTLQNSHHSEVYNLQGCRRLEEEQVIYNTLYPILEQRKAQFRSDGELLSPEDHIAIVLEEAQNYAPSTRSTLCKDLLVEIARIGRKYGMHILLLSQRPRYIDQTILSQCGGGMFFNLPNPEDVDYVMNSASLNRSTPFKHMIQNFDMGECILLRAEKSAMDLLCKISSF